MSHHSKFLALVLRHNPGLVNIKLDPAGWANVDDLLKGMKSAGRPIRKDQLFSIVADNDKKRYTLSDDKKRIRAAQGHSIPVALGNEILMPPANLFHGTSRRSLDGIFARGIIPMKRQQVHLSVDVETAIKVGSRHGKVAVLWVNTGKMHEDGFTFMKSDNGVWLTETVPPVYLSFGSPV